MIIVNDQDHRIANILVFRILELHCFTVFKKDILNETEIKTDMYKHKIHRYSASTHPHNIKHWTSVSYI